MENNIKICSLLPSATEIVYALGLEESLVAVTHECDYPVEASHKPCITRSSISPALSSAEIDFRVRRQLSDAGTLYHLDVDLLESLKPDIILTQRLCAVCAVSYENVARIAHSLSSKPQVINLEPTSLEGIYQTIETVGVLTGVRDQARDLIKHLRGRVRRIQHMTSRCEKKKVLCLEWLEPPFCAGHWIPELVELAGGSDELGEKHRPSRQVAWERILSYNPEVLVVMCCGFSIERALQEIVILRQRDTLGSVQEGNVYVVDGSSYFSRPGPRIVDSLEILATIVHPELFPIDYPANVVRQVTFEVPILSQD